MPTQEDKLGALWLKTSAKGAKFMSGKINGVDVVIFKNTFKEEEKHPDYIVYKSQPREPRQ
jgi:uncharacterized protein (DUF736 family)